MIDCVQSEMWNAKNNSKCEKCIVYTWEKENENIKNILQELEEFSTAYLKKLQNT